MIASIGCSSFGASFPFQKPLSQKQRSTFLPSQSTATFISSLRWIGANGASVFPQSVAPRRSPIQANVRVDDINDPFANVKVGNQNTGTVALDAAPGSNAAGSP